MAAFAASVSARRASTRPRWSSLAFWARACLSASRARPPREFVVHDRAEPEAVVCRSYVLLPRLPVHTPTAVEVPVPAVSQSPHPISSLRRVLRFSRLPRFAGVMGAMVAIHTARMSHGGVRYTRPHQRWPALPGGCGRAASPTPGLRGRGRHRRLSRRAACNLRATEPTRLCFWLGIEVFDGSRPGSVDPVVAGSSPVVIASSQGRKCRNQKHLRHSRFPLVKSTLATPAAFHRISQGPHPPAHCSPCRRPRRRKRKEALPFEGRLPCRRARPPPATGLRPVL